MRTKVMKANALLEAMKILFKPHPWHGVSIGDHAPDRITCYIEIVPADTVKYEMEKTTGYLRIDRPQKYSNSCPCLYGLVPQTFCGERVAALMSQRTGRPGLRGDGDPLDVCVLAERPISHGDLLLEAIPIGGLAMLDGNEADDKVVAVLKDDPVFGALTDLSQCPGPMVERLRHYFLTYKQIPGSERPFCEIPYVYGKAEATAVILASQEDYNAMFGGLSSMFDELLSGTNHSLETVYSARSSKD